MAVRDNNPDIISSTESTTSALRTESSINAVAAANDDALLGALKAFDTAGRRAAKSCIAGSGGGAESLAAVRDGSLYAVTALQYKQDAEQNVDQMLQMVVDPQSVGLQLLTPIETITR